MFLAGQILVHTSVLTSNNLRYEKVIGCRSHKNWIKLWIVFTFWIIAWLPWPTLVEHIQAEDAMLLSCEG